MRKSGKWTVPSKYGRSWSRAHCSISRASRSGRPSLSARPAILLLQPFLVLPLELAVEDDAADVGALRLAGARPRACRRDRAARRGIARARGSRPPRSLVRAHRARSRRWASRRWRPRSVSVRTRSRPSRRHELVESLVSKMPEVWLARVADSSRDSRRSRSATTRNAPMVASVRLSSPFSSYR